VTPERPPSVDAVYRRIEARCAKYPRELVMADIRRSIEKIRAGSLKASDLDADVLRSLEELERPSLRQLINATGVILHTNLGRAPLAATGPSLGYSNLEYDLAAGQRGKRDTHYAGLIQRLLGAPGIAVNNNAAAVFLVLQELAAGFEVIVSRGELIEIGDGFRIPDIMARSGAVIREVGTTNKTTIEDYRAAVTARTRLILRVHPSNFRVTGFTAKPSLHELSALGKEGNIPVFEDLGSGCVMDLKPHGIEEPLAQTSLAAGIDLISFSCDKLLGGPQTGIVAGRADLVARIRRNPLYRAFRCDKLIVGALEMALRSLVLERYDEIPALRMIRLSGEDLKARALKLSDGLAAEVIPGESVIGGGATPEQTLPTWLIALRGDAVEWERQLRANDPPIVARVHDDRLVIDLRTVFPSEEPELRKALVAYARAM
jgi:L-seryl-tRNA(Ser) seleniumtransferase